MALFKRNVAAAPSSKVQVARFGGHPGATAFAQQLQSGDFGGALHTYRSLPSWELREFYTGIDETALDPGPPALPRWVEGLVAAYPDESLSWTLRGRLGITVAWEIRGGGRAQTVGEDAWPRFFEYLRGAEDDLLRATRLDPSDPLPWGGLLTTARGLQIPKEELVLRFQEVEKRATDVYGAYHNALQGLCAKWSGSHEEMFSFARHKAIEGGDGSPRHDLVVQAHIERMIDDEGYKPSRYFVGEVREEVLDAARHSILHPDFRDDELHPAGVECRNIFALGLAFCGLGQEAQRQTMLIGTRLMEWPWLMFGDPATIFAKVRSG